jgi:cation transporter-like permease
MFQDLARPFAYLSIRHQSGLPSFINWWLPGGLALLVASASVFGGVQLRLFGAEGLVQLLLGFVQTLTGFYLAALAAMATFDSPSMDRPMPGTPPVMQVKHNGELTEVDATRRRFLCSMFSYLTASSFAFTVVSIVIIATASGIKSLLNPDASLVLRSALMLGYLFAVAQMTTITFWGLYYMGERVHTDD